MAEGFDPIEAGKKLHEHGEKHEQAEQTEQGVQAGQDEQGGHRGHGGSNGRHSRIVQICEAVLLALVTITAAWAGYSAARWNTASRVEIARSATLRNLATRASLNAISLRNFDSSTFNAWYIAFTLGNRQKELVAERRLRPQFRVAFNAWMATDPLHNPHAPPGPTYMPQYKLAGQRRLVVLDRKAGAEFAAGNHAGTVGDDYVRITVFLAAVLFLVGIGSSFKLHGIRYALIVFGTTLLIVSIVLLARQPVTPG
jgi:hypothetical protein